MEDRPVRVTLRAGGMYCAHCERRVSQALMKLPGVQAAEASFAREEIIVTYFPGETSREALVSCIENLGYSVQADRGRVAQIASILVILLAAWLIARHLGWTQVFNVFPTIETTMSLGALFVVGLLTSVHCIAMCGGINLTQSAMATRGGGRLVRANLAYNAGRVLSYTAIGGLAGGIGSALSFSGSMRGLIALLAGALMLLMALSMLGVFKGLRNLRPRRVESASIGLLSRIRRKSSFVIGLLNGFMPCGPLQSMQIYALSAGSAPLGALSMLLFSLGTVPLMFGFGLFSGKLNQKYARVMLTVSALLIFVMGLNMLGNGLSLAGVSLPQVGGSAWAAVLDGDVQRVRTEIDYGSYEPITVMQGVPVEWIIYAPEEKLNGCNGEIVIPAYDLTVRLQPGENKITFTPEAAGTIPYSCWMGMIKSAIEVTEAP